MVCPTQPLLTQAPNLASHLQFLYGWIGSVVTPATPRKRSQSWQRQAVPEQCSPSAWGGTRSLGPSGAVQVSAEGLPQSRAGSSVAAECYWNSSFSLVLPQSSLQISTKNLLILMLLMKQKRGEETPIMLAWEALRALCCTLPELVVV